MTDIPVKQYIKQIEDGEIYQGYMEIAGVRFDYEIVFTPSLNQPCREECENKLKAEDFAQLTVKRDDKIIELTNKENNIFLFWIVNFVMDMLAMKQVSSHEIAKKISPDQDPCSTLSFNAEGSGTIEFAPELCKILNSPKFGCNIPLE